MENTPARQAQDEYLDRLRKVLRRAPVDIREDALREVLTHIEDEWQALGRGDDAMHQVLDRLGPPETYGRDLALQLMLQSGSYRRKILPLIKGAIFWASTSLFGSLLVMAAALFLAYGVGMLIVAIIRQGGNSMMLVNATNSQIFGMEVEKLLFPPQSWSPLGIAMVGILPVLVVFLVLYRFYIHWVRSRLAAKGLEWISSSKNQVLKAGWERRAVLSTLVFALIGSSTCALFTIVSEITTLGQPSQLSLPQDIFRNPMLLLAFLGGLVFLSAPVLGVLWAARK